MFTLTKEEFTKMHNALYDLDCARSDLESVVAPTLMTRLNRAATELRKGMKAVYEQESAQWRCQQDYFESVQRELKCRSVWSLFDHDVDDFYTEHAYAGATVLKYEDSWGKPVEVPLAGNRWVDLYIAADYLIKESGDEHHIFIERFAAKEEDPSVLFLRTGS